MSEQDEREPQVVIAARRAVKALYLDAPQFVAMGVEGKVLALIQALAASEAEVATLRRERDRLRQALVEKADEWRRQSDALTSWPREQALMNCAAELNDVLAAVPAPPAPQEP